MIHDLFHATFICRSKTDPKVILATLQQFPPGGGIGRMSHVILIDMIDHIRDLETYLKHCRDAINDIDEDLELFNDMKDTEIMVLAQQKSNYNRQAEQRKQKISKEIQLITHKIETLTETVQSSTKNVDIERTVSPSESALKDRPQNLNVEV